MKDLRGRLVVLGGSLELFNRSKDLAGLAGNDARIAELLEIDRLRSFNDLHVTAETPGDVDRLVGDIGNLHPHIHGDRLLVERKQPHGEARHVDDKGDLAGTVAKHLPVTVAQSLDVHPCSAADRYQGGVGAAELGPVVQTGLLHPGKLGELGLELPDLILGRLYRNALLELVMLLAPKTL
jgi:hypothetical protein